MNEHVYFNEEWNEKQAEKNSNDISGLSRSSSSSISGSK